MPLIVYLHGGSGKGDDLTILTTIDGFPKYLRSGELGDVRAYVLMPQLPANQKGWSDAAESVYTLIQQTVVRFALDPHNVSLTGHSMGGTGTFALATTYPRLFARIAPLSGSVRTTPETLLTLKSIPMKVFVGAADTIVSPASSEELVQALNGMGGQADIAVFENADHFAVPALTYLDERIDLISWLIDAL